MARSQRSSFVGAESTSDRQKNTMTSSPKAAENAGDQGAITDLYSQHYGYEQQQLPLSYVQEQSLRYAHTPTPSEAGDVYNEDWDGDCWWPNHEEGGANPQVGWPTMPMKDNGSGKLANQWSETGYVGNWPTNGQGMGSYANTDPKLVPTQSPSGSLASGPIFMQPVVYMQPVFFPMGQMPPGQFLPASPHAYESMLAQTQMELPATHADERSRRPSKDSAQSAEQWYNEVTTGSTAPEAKQGKSRRAALALKKKLPGAVRPDEVEKLKLAVHQTMQSYRQGSPAASPVMKPIQFGEFEEDDDTSPPCVMVHQGFVEDCKAPSAKPAEGRGGMRCADNVDPMLLELESGDQNRRERIFGWVLESFWPLALNKKGCRVVQKSIDVGSPAFQFQLLENLRGHVYQAMQSPHANYVLQKFIEIMPPDQIDFIVLELQGQVLHVARHRFGCRILQRLVEHCTNQQTQRMINKLLGDTTALLRHEYGNFVLQHVLQHGTPSQRSVIADAVLTDIIRLSKHRLASHVVSCALIHCPSEDVQRLTQAVLQDAGQLSQLSRREYGSFVVREVHRAMRLLKSNRILPDGTLALGEEMALQMCE